jgi:F0F1-type ATP synthase assembly protein I
MAFSFGVTMIAGTLLGLYAGTWLDRRLGTSPLFLVAGVLLGAGAGFRSILSELHVLGGKAREKNNDDGDETHPD